MTHAFTHRLGMPPVNRQQGASLIEVLVSVVILAIGLLGMLGLQAASLRNNQSASERTVAVVASYAIIDAMRANRTAALAGAYNYDIDTPNCAPPSGATQANLDVAQWLNSLRADLGPTACGNINCLLGVCTVRIRWNDERATGGQAAFQIDTEVRL
jgi:type IV pilus assembly protein PilV